jgi:hypothetical protein
MDMLHPFRSIQTSDPSSRKFFDRTDWLSGTIAAVCSLTVYLATLTPDVTLGFSGSFSVAARYGAVSHPPGYPLFAIYAWLFTHLLRFSNVAWRVAVASAVAASLSCAMIALLVSRSAAGLLSGQTTPRSLSEREVMCARVICGWSAGPVFGFNGAFWERAVLPDAWTLSVCMLCLFFCLVRRWQFQPERRGYLCAASFVYGLALTNSQSLFILAPAIPFLVLPGSKALSRDCFLTGTTFLAIAAIRVTFYDYTELEFPFSELSAMFSIILLVGAVFALMTGLLIWQTRRVLTEWKAMLGCAGALSLGLSLYLYLPVASMTNPPMNWGYARTVGGFIHVLSRGQYERIQPTKSAKQFGRQIKFYAAVTAKEFGWIYLPFALLPFCWIRRVPQPERGWLAGLSVVYVCLAFLLLAVLNPHSEMQKHRTVEVFFSASYVVLAVWFGCGLAMLVPLLAREARPTLPSPSAA